MVQGKTLIGPDVRRLEDVPLASLPFQHAVEPPNFRHRQKMSHVDLKKRFSELSIEVELGFSAEQTARAREILDELAAQPPDSDEG